MNQEDNTTCCNSNETCCATEEIKRTAKPSFQSNKTETGVTLTVDLPGVAKEDVRIKSEGKSLQITANRSDTVAEDWQLINDADTITDYKLNLELHPDLNLAATKAKYDSGVLTLEISKHESSLPRDINIL